jgi:hypothetical protein
MLNAVSNSRPQRFDLVLDSDGVSVPKRLTKITRPSGGPERCSRSGPIGWPAHRPSRNWVLFTGLSALLNRQPLS